MEKTFKTGKYTPRYPEKYLGDLDNITFRSSWELKAFEWMDGNIRVLKWGSEIIPISYMKPVMTPKGLTIKPAKYFPDIFVIYKNKHNKIIKELIEIKPSKQTKLSKSRNPKTKLEENFIFQVNNAKFNAAQQWCNKYGIKFSVVTEKDIFI